MIPLADEKDPLGQQEGGEWDRAAWKGWRRDKAMGSGAHRIRCSNLWAFPPKTNPKGLKMYELKYP